MRDNQKDKKIKDENKFKDTKVNKKTNKILLTILLILIILIIAVGIMWGGRILNKIKLDREIKLLYEKNIDTDNFNNITLQTTGEFNIVENEIKNFFKDYASMKKLFLEKVNDERIINMLSVSNYETDGPEFNDSINYINTQKEEFNKISNDFINLLEENSIISRIENKDVSEYYKNLYKSYFIEDGTLNQDITNFNADIKEATELMNKLYDNEIKLLNFLKDHKENWEILNGKLTFDSATLSTEYNNIKAQMIAG